MKHNKLKNTGIVFDLLCKRIMHETLNPTLPSHAIKIVKKHFTNTSLLLKEVKLYHQLSNHSNIKNPSELIDLVIEGRKKLNNELLNVEKYNLIKSIKKNYTLSEFYSSRLENYKVLASVYNLFENTDNQTNWLLNKEFISESISTPIENTPNQVEQILSNEDKVIRKLSFKIIVEKFNDKYQGLNEKQKTLLSKYINVDAMSDDFKNYIINECNWIGKQLTNKMTKLNDPIQRIKLQETVNLLDHIIVSDKVKEEHLSSMLTYYELINEL